MKDGTGRPCASVNATFIDGGRVNLTGVWNWTKSSLFGSAVVTKESTCVVAQAKQMTVVNAHVHDS